ncbi:MAG: hypothetical protein AAGJ35_15400, partial [Myxococcota bacterium]
MHSKKDKPPSNMSLHILPSPSASYQGYMTSGEISAYLDDMSKVNSQINPWEHFDQLMITLPEQLGQLSVCLARREISRPQISFAKGL